MCYITHPAQPHVDENVLAKRQTNQPPERLHPALLQLQTSAHQHRFRESIFLPCAGKKVLRRLQSDLGSCKQSVHLPRFIESTKFCHQVISHQDASTQPCAAERKVRISPDPSRARYVVIFRGKRPSKGLRRPPKEATRRPLSCPQAAEKIEHQSGFLGKHKSLNICHHGSKPPIRLQSALCS